MRKIIAFFLVLGLLLSVTLPALADEDAIQTEQMLQSVKARIEDTEQFQTFHSSFGQTDGRSYYSFHWSTEQEDTYKSMSVTVSASHIITNYSFDGDGEQVYRRRARINKLTTAEVLPRAQALVDRLNPQLAGELRVVADNSVENLYDEHYSFSVARYYNGIPVYGDTGYVRIDGAAERILNFSVTYTEGLTFASAEAAISPQQAQQAFAAQLGMQLEYRMERDGKSRTVYAVYVPIEREATYIHALTGEAVRILPNNVYRFASKETALAAADMNAGGGMFTPVEQNELDRIANIQSITSIQKQIFENGVIALPAGMALHSHNLYKDQYEDKYYYSLSFETKEEETYQYAGATVDAVTGEIYSIYFHKDKMQEKPALRTEQMRAIADRAAAKLAGERFEEYAYREEEGRATYREAEERNYFSYVRLVNGVPFSADRITVMVDAADGTVFQYDRSYSQVEFPAVDGAIGLDAATARLFEQVDYSIYYMPTRSDEALKQPDCATPVYMLEASKTGKIDAFTGELLGYANKPYEDQSPMQYTDIAGHYAEVQIEKLAQYGICFAEEQFQPDAQILQKDYIALLVAAFRNYVSVIRSEADRDEAYQIAKYNGIITAEEWNPSQSVTREWAAEFMVRAMGIAEYAGLSGIYVSPFSDVSEHVGAISILGAMGIVKGEGDGLFHPKGILTRADAAILIYNYLSRS